MKHKEQIKEFLETLFSGLKGYIELRTINSNKDIKQFFYSTGDIERLLDDLNNDNEFVKDSNIYFGVSPRKIKEGKENNIKRVNCLWIDLDCNGDEERELNLKKLNSFDPSPSIIINSGYGYHIYWLLEEPYLVKNNKDKIEIKGYLKGLAIALKGDKCFDLARVLRIPGTLNLKDPKNPLLVSIIKFEPSLKYKLEKFNEYKVDLEANLAKDITIFPVDIPKKFWEILKEDKKLKNTWERKRPDLNDQSGSGYDMSLADQLKMHGFNNSEIAAILRKAPSGKGKEASPAYLKHTIAKTENMIKTNKKSHTSSRQNFNPRPYSNEIREKYRLKYDKYKRFRIYDNESGIWKDQAELILNSILRKKILGNKDYKKYCVEEIIADLKGLDYDSVLPQEPEPYLIPFNNEIYDIKNDRLIEYSPDYFFINKLPVNFNKNHKVCPTIDRVFNELVAPDDVITLYEIIAYCLYRAYPYSKIFFLYGSGGNGKTAYTKILNRVLGKENISLVSCNDLQNNRFASSQLFGKLCNISGEMEYSILKNTSILKQCCGEDLINCERKFREPFPFTNCAKMIFLTNQVPLTADRSKAFYRRIFLLEFPNEFIIGKNADPLIIEKIPQEEIEGLVWKCVQILKELVGRGFVFSRHENTEKIIKKYERLSNPLEAFLEEKVEKDYENYIPVNEFKKQFEEYLKAKKYNPWTPQKLNKGMKEISHNQTIKNNERVWGNTKWK